MAKSIYDLDNENGAQILGGIDNTAPAIQVNSNAPGYAAISSFSTASGSPVHARSFAVSSKFEAALTGVAPALEVNSFAPGYNALNIASTASGYPIDVTAIQATYGARFRSTATAGNAVIIGKTVNSSITVAALQFLGTSVASAAIMQFAGGFISCTSILLGNGSAADYALPVVVGGQVRYIPLIKGADIVGGAAF